MAKEPVVTAESDLGKKSRNTKAKEIPYEDLKAAALLLPIHIRAALSKQLKESVQKEVVEKQEEAKQAEGHLNGL